MDNRESGSDPSDRHPGMIERYDPNCLAVESQYEHLVVVLPKGSTWRAVNAGYMFLKDKLEMVEPGELDTRESSSVICQFAHTNIVPLLDTQQEFSRYPFDHRIAFDLMFTLRLALTRAQIGRGLQETIESTYLGVDCPETTVGSNREMRQLAMIFKFKPLPR